MTQSPPTPIFSTARDIDGTSGDLHTNRPGVARMAGGFGSLPLAQRENSPVSAKDGTPLVPVESEASPLLVILHYLLKNNMKFMTCCGAGMVGHPRPSVDLQIPIGGAQLW